MKTTSFSNVQIPAMELKSEFATTQETPILGRSNAKRVTTTTKDSSGAVTVILVEEFHGERLMSRMLEQNIPNRTVTRELYESDGSLISSETERRDPNGRNTKIVVRGSGKSSTTRILSGDVEARATERSVLIETPKASYSFYPFDGKWSSFYKEINMKLELKANFLKSPDSVLNGPDGLKIVFKGGRMVDLIVSAEFDASTSEIPSGADALI